MGGLGVFNIFGRGLSLYSFFELLIGFALPGAALGSYFSFCW